MKKQLILLFTLAFAGIFSAAAQDPIYVVNGQVVSDIRNIPPGDIESTEMLPADEQTIARYGTEASNGVILITLRYDTPARFPEADGSNIFPQSCTNCSHCRKDRGHGLSYSCRCLDKNLSFCGYSVIYTGYDFSLSLTIFKRKLQIPY